MGRKKVKAKRKRTDREKLDLFLDRCEELAQLEALRQPFGYNSGYTIIGTTLVEHKLDEPSDRDLRSVIGELGEKVGVSYFTISNWELGVKQPRVKNLRALADALGIRPEQIVLIEGKGLPVTAA